jgi:2-polyprenyl-3-methyl-5-hydroxy-6-metoxy-1,4-benzoquinol methylase
MKKMFERIVTHLKNKTLASALVSLVKAVFNLYDSKKDYRVLFSEINNTMESYGANENEILSGNIPERYTRLLPFIPGSRILEIGAGEGVLALLLSREKEKVYALDISEFRHKKGLNLQNVWRKKGISVDRCEMIHANLVERLDLLEDIDTVVAVRVIYYWRDEIYPMFEMISRHAKHVVLCGNASKLSRYNENRNKYLFYSTVEGMMSILENNGYRITTIDERGDPIVVGTK